MLGFRAGMKRYLLGVCLFAVVASCGGESRSPPDSAESDCSDVQDASLARLAEADAHVTGECRFQSDCRLFTGNTECVHGCGFVASTRDEAPLRAAVDEVNALCPDECRQPAPPCVPTQQVADCVAGRCVVVDALNVADCEAIRAESVQVLSEAASNALVECDSASDCHLFTGNPECVYGCGWVVAATDDAPLQIAVAEVDALCRDDCRQPEPPCVFLPQVADCVAGKCVVVDELRPQDCNAVRTESMRMLAEAASNAPLSCDSSSDCLLFGTRPKCVYDCGFSAATTDVAPLQSAVDEVDALCPDECVQPASSCPPPVAREVVECVAGECVLKTLE
jgi:hypothetical protein